MATTPNIGITLLTAGQAGAELTMNDALNRLDATAALSVINATETSAPASPSAGDSYIIAGTGGDWSTFTSNDVAFYDGSTWYNVTPYEGLFAYDKAANLLKYWTGSTWTNYTGSLSTAISTLESEMDEVQVLSKGIVINSSATTSPGSPSTGDAYIIAGTGGSWSGFTTNDVAFYDGAAWQNVTPTEGLRMYDVARNDLRVYDGSAWVDYLNDILDGQVEDLSGHIISPVVKTFVLDQSASYLYKVNQIRHQILSGTSITFTMKIGSSPTGTLTAITGITGQTSTTTEATDTATANNTVSPGQCLVLEVTANSGTPTDFTFTVKTTREPIS